MALCCTSGVQLKNIGHMHKMLEGGLTDDTRPYSATPYGNKSKKANGETVSFEGRGIGDKRDDEGGAKPASETDYTKTTVKATDPGFYN